MIISPMLPRRVLATVVAVGALTVVATPVALAHDSVIGGNPADGEVVEEFPRRIELEFSGLPQEGFSTVAITDQGSGDLLFSGEPTIDGRLVTLDLPAGVSGGPGDYTVGFQILSSDGHATRSATTFTVAGDAQTAATTTGATTGADAQPGEETTAAENTAEEDTSVVSNPIVLILAGLALIGVIAAVLVLILRGRNTPTG